MTGVSYPHNSSWLKCLSDSPQPLTSNPSPATSERDLRMGSESLSDNSEPGIPGPSPTMGEGEVLSAPKAVLVLENDTGVRESIMKWFINRGFEILESASPDDALIQVQQSHLPIGVAVVDMSMPVMWGDAFARQLALISPETKVIFISGHSEEFLKALGSLTDGDIFFAKPYSCKALLYKVWELLGMEIQVIVTRKLSEILNEIPQDPHFAEHLDFHIENDQRVK